MLNMAPSNGFCSGVQVKEVVVGGFWWWWLVVVGQMQSKLA